MSDAALCWRIEAACRHAWPALVGGWVQVDSAYRPALALYRAMGFARSLFPYRYWVRPGI